MTKPLSPEPTIRTRIARGYVDLQLVLEKEGLKNDVKGFFICMCFQLSCRKYAKVDLGADYRLRLEVHIY